MKPIIHFSFILTLICSSCFKDRLPQDEIILMDDVFTHVNSEDDDKKMGFSIFPFPDDLPGNWKKPVNLKDGEVHIRVSILSKPDNLLIYYQLGFQWEGGCDGNPLKEKIGSRDMFPITSAGMYNASQSLPSFWEPACQENDPIDWTLPMDRILVILLDKNFNPIDNRWGYGENIENIDGYFPMQVHLQVIVVPVGGEFSGWENYEITAPPDF